MQNKSIRRLLTCAVVFGLFGVQPTYAADPEGMEKCYGIAEAGQNDCEPSAAGVCDKSVIDADPNYWMYVPTGMCNRIVGGMTTMGLTPNTIQNTPTLPPPATNSAPGTMSTTPSTTPSTPATPPPSMPGVTTPSSTTPPPAAPSTTPSTAPTSGATSKSGGTGMSGGVK